MKRTLTALIILVLASGLYWFFEVKKKSDDTAKKETEESVFPGLKAADVVKLKIGDTVLEKQGAEFRIIAPIKTYSDNYAVDALVKQLAEMKAYRKLDEADGDAYGFNSPQGSFTLYDSKGAEYQLVIGSANPAGTHVYARINTGDGTRVNGKPGAVMVGNFAADAVKKKTDDLRFKGMARFDVDAITKVKSTVTGREFTAVKKGNDWVLESHANAPVKWENLKMALSAIKSASAKKFYKLGGDYGFKKDRDYIYIEEGEKTEMIFFGRHDKKNVSVFVRDSALDYAVEAPDYIFTNAPMAENFINKQPLVFEPEKVFGFSVAMKDKYLYAQKDKKGAWKIKKANGLRDTKNINVAALLSAVYGLEAQARYPGTSGKGNGFFGPDMNNLKIEIYDDKNKILGSVTFAEKPTGDVIYVRNNATQEICEVKRSAVSGMDISGMEVPK